jgi:hypothetical protein
LRDEGISVREQRHAPISQPVGGPIRNFRPTTCRGHPRRARRRDPALEKGASRTPWHASLVGEIASDDAGEGAAIGAAAGMVAGRRRAKSAQKQATQQDMDNFKKAFSVCLEAKSYMVKY